MFILYWLLIYNVYYVDYLFMTKLINIGISWRIKITFNVETLDDYEHANWVLEESPPFLTNEKINVLDNDLANITI